MFVVILINSLKLLAVIFLLFALRNCDSRSFHGNFLRLLLDFWMALAPYSSFKKLLVSSKSGQLHTFYFLLFWKLLTGERTEIPVMGIVLSSLEMQLRRTLFQMSENSNHCFKQKTQIIGLSKRKRGEKRKKWNDFSTKSFLEKNSSSKHDPQAQGISFDSPMCYFSCLCFSVCWLHLGGSLYMTALVA